MRPLKNYTAKSYISHDGTNIYYDQTPGKKEKPTLIFLHGIGADAAVWDGYRIFFGQGGFPTLAIDLRGHGFSQRNPEPLSYTIENLAKDIAGIVKKEKLKEYIILGHCLGGMVSVVATTNKLIFPKKLILIGTGCEAPDFGKILTKRKFFQKSVMLLAKIPLRLHFSHRPDYTTSTYVGTKEIYFKRLLLDVLHTSIQSYVAVFSFFISFESVTSFRNIKIPTLIISGSDDLFFPVRMSERLSKEIPFAQVAVIPHANHILILNNPKELTDIIAPFITL